MRRLGIGCADGILVSLLKKLHILGNSRFGDRLKSWDVLKTVRFLSERLVYKDPILDLGAYASEILPVLKHTGFTALTGIDLNPDLMNMPDTTGIKYVIGNFYESGLPAESFLAVTAISVIEHGFDCQRLLSEISRILITEGYFIASFDYWPDKIDTRGIKAFDLDWNIFSSEEVQKLLDEALRLGLVPVGNLDFTAANAPIVWMGKSYTFAWIVLQKKNPYVQQP